MSEPHAATHGVKLLPAETPSGGVLAWADPVRLRQVLLNLLSNAIKYNRPGGWVGVVVHRQAESAAIEVIDNGLGLTEHQRGGLFQPFNRLGRENSAVPGTGLGLVVTRQLVELMEGTLELLPNDDQGTRACVTLRCREPAHSSGRPVSVRPAAKATAPPADAGVPLRGLLVYVEDDPINALLVEQILARWPEVRLLVAVDAATGAACIRQTRPDLVLLDMQLPDAHGTEVLKQLQADPATRDIPVVALSASALPADMAAALRAGARDYWTKPIDVRHFEHGLRRWLTERRQLPPGTA